MMQSLKIKHLGVLPLSFPIVCLVFIPLQPDTTCLCSPADAIYGIGITPYGTINTFNYNTFINIP